MKTAWLIFLVIALCLFVLPGCGKYVYNTGVSQETLDTMATFLSMEGFPVRYSDAFKKPLEKYSYQGERVSQIKGYQMDGVGAGGFYAYEQDYGVAIFYHENGELHSDYNLFYTTVELDGLILPFGIGLGDSIDEVFQKIGITVSPGNQADEVITLFANARAKFTLYTGKSWKSIVMSRERYDCNYFLQYEETYQTKQDNGEDITITCAFALGFLTESGKLGYVEIAIEETRPVA